LTRAALFDQSLPGKSSLHQKAYRFALNNPYFSAVISNMVTRQQAKENLAAVTTKSS
jgi:aryl-alcohol dehydrogenase-like predicted oxidoreductase